MLDDFSALTGTFFVCAGVRCSCPAGGSIGDIRRFRLQHVRCRDIKSSVHVFWLVLLDRRHGQCLDATRRNLFHQCRLLWVPPANASEIDRPLTFCTALQRPATIQPNRLLVAPLSV